MSGIYCGVGKVPKKSRLGTMKECASQKQIRLYGLIKVDKKVLGQGNEMAKYKKRHMKALKNYHTYKGRERKLRGKVQAAKGDKKIEAQKELDEVIKLVNKYAKELRDVEKNKPRRQARLSGSRARSRSKSKSRPRSRSRSRSRSRTVTRTSRRSRSRSRSKPKSKSRSKSRSRSRSVSRTRTVKVSRRSRKSSKKPLRKLRSRG